MVFHSRKERTSHRSDLIKGVLLSELTSIFPTRNTDRPSFIHPPRPHTLMTILTTLHNICKPHTRRVSVHHLLHDNRDVVVHVLVDVSEEAGCNDGDTTEGDRYKIDVLVRLGVGDLARGDDHVVGLLAAGDSGDEFEVVEQGSGGQFDGFGDKADVGDAEFKDHGATDVLDGVGLELLGEDVVVDGVADGAADDADGQSQSGHGGDQVIRADDGSHDGCWDDNAADTDTSQDQETPEGSQVVDTSDGQAATAGGHKDRGHNHQLTVVAAEDRQQPEDDAGTS